MRIALPRNPSGKPNSSFRLGNPELGQPRIEPRHHLVVRVGAIRPPQALVGVNLLLRFSFIRTMLIAVKLFFVEISCVD
jgi:hypothetical protein